MLTTTNEVKAAWLSPARKLAIKIEMDDTMYDNNTVTSLTFDSGSISGESFQIGSTYINSIKIIFPNIIESIAEGLEILPFIGIDINGNVEYTPLGKFTISEFDRDRNSQTTTVTANDEMSLLEGPYLSKLKYPARIRDVALEIANLAGVEVDKVSFSTLETAAIKQPIGYSFRQAISLIAQFEGGYATFNRDGKLSIKRLTPTEFKVTPANYLLKGFKKNEMTYRIGGIRVRTGENEKDFLTVGSAQGAQVELENSVMTQVLLNQMWDRVKRISYFPFELRWQGMPALEAGDWIYIKDKEGKEYSVPNLSFSFEFNGGMVASSSANTTTTGTANYRYRGTLSQKIEYIDSILSSNDWNSNYYDSETAPENPRIGDLWFKQNGQDIEIWIYKEIDGKEDWFLEISTAPNDELKEAIENAQSEAEKAKEQANAAVNSANQAIKDSGLALSTAQGVQHEVNRIDGLAVNALNEAQSAKKQAEELLETVDDQSGQIISLTTDVNTVKGEIALKANQTDFNKLEGTVKNQGTLISQNAKEIGLKANQTEVNTINNTVISHSSTLKIQSESITSLVSKTDGQQTQISNLKLESDKITSTVSNVQHDLENLGNGNLLPRTDFSNLTIESIREWWSHGASNNIELNNATYENMKGSPMYRTVRLVCQPNAVINGTGFFNTKSAENGDYEVLKPNTTYTYSFWGYRESSCIDTYLIIWSYDDDGGSRTNFKRVNSALPIIGKSQLFETTFTTNDRVNYQIRIYTTYETNNTGPRRLFLSDVQLTESTIRMAWSPSYWDRTNVKQFSQLEQTALGIQSTVTNLETQTSSQITQLSGQITSVVKELDELTIGGSNLIRDSSFDEEFKHYRIAQRGYSIDKNKLLLDQPTLKFQWETGSPQYAAVGTDFIEARESGLVGQMATSSIYVFIPEEADLGTNPYFEVTSYNNVGQTTNTMIPGGRIDIPKTIEKGKWHRFTKTFAIPELTAGEPTNYIRVLMRHRAMIGLVSEKDLFWYGLPQLEIGTKATAWSKGPIDGATQSQITQLSDTINLRVEKDKIVNQINISPEGILIDGKKVHITGQTFIDNAVIKSAMIADAAITNAKIQNASISSAKIINLDAAKIVAGEVNGLVIRSITGTGRFKVEGQDATFQDTKSNRSVKINSEGFFLYNPNGTLRAQHTTTVVNSGMLGTSTTNVYLATGGTDGEESTGGEVRAISYASAPGSGAVTDYAYRPVRAEGFIGNYINVNTPFAGAHHLYLRPRYGTGEVRVTGSGTTGAYQELRAKGFYGNTYDINTALTGEHIYIRPSTSGEVRFTRINTTNVLSDFRGAVGFVQSLSQSVTGTNFYIGTDGEVRITSRGLATAGTIYYRDIRAANFITNSLEESKQNIQEYRMSALEIVDSATIYNYRLRSEVAEAVDREHIGLVIGSDYQTPKEIITNGGVNQYAMSSLAWKAIQELSEKINKLEDVINE